MVNQVLYCDWLHERASWCYIPRSGLPPTVSSAFFSFIGQACPVKIAGFHLKLCQDPVILTSLEMNITLKLIVYIFYELAAIYMASNMVTIRIT